VRAAYTTPRVYPRAPARRALFAPPMNARGGAEALMRAASLLLSIGALPLGDTVIAPKQCQHWCNMWTVRQHSSSGNTPQNLSEI